MWLQDAATFTTLVPEFAAVEARGQFAAAQRITPLVSGRAKGLKESGAALQFKNSLSIFLLNAPGELHFTSQLV